MKKLTFSFLSFLCFVVLEPVMAQVDFTTVITQPQCPNTNTGNIEVIPTGATGPFTIIINGNFGQPERLVTSAGSYTFSGLGRGAYFIVVSANGQNCQTIQKRVQLVDPQDFYGSIYQIDSTCAPCDVNLLADFQPANNYSYLWSTNQITPKITGVCDGNYTLTVTKLSTGCQNQYSITATNVLPSLTMTTPGSICQDQESSFSFEVVGTNSGPCLQVNPDSVSWDFGDGTGSLDLSPTHTYTSIGTYTLQLSVNGVLYASSSITVDSPSISFYNNQDCSAPRRFSFYSSNSCISGSDFSWDFGDPNSGSNTSTDQNPTHEFSTVGNFTVTLTVGSQTTSNTVTVFENPNQEATITAFPNSCRTLPYNRQFSAYLQCAQSYRWNFGDQFSGINNSSTSSSPNHNFSGPGTYQVTLTTDSGQFYGIVKTISVVIDNPVTNTPSPDGTLDFLGDTITIGPAMDAGFTYSWQNGPAISPRKVSQPGIYILTKSNPSNPNACFSFDTILVNYCGQFTSENTETLATEFFSVYPNPVNDKIHFSDGIVGRYQILNTHGQILGEGTLTEEMDGIKTQGIPNGLYFLRWRSDKGSSGSLKFLVEGK